MKALKASETVTCSVQAPTSASKGYLYPDSYPLDADLDTMVKDGYWFATEIVNNFYPSYIGMYGDTRDNSYWFWHSFVSVDGVIPDGVDVTVMYQMGDEDSNWEGVHILGEASMPEYDYQMQHRTLSNAGWNQ